MQKRKNEPENRSQEQNKPIRTRKYFVRFTRKTKGMTGEEGRWAANARWNASRRALFGLVSLPVRSENQRAMMIIFVDFSFAAKIDSGLRTCLAPRRARLCRGIVADRAALITPVARVMYGNKGNARYRQSRPECPRCHCAGASSFQRSIMIHNIFGNRVSGRIVNARCSITTTATLLSAAAVAPLQVFAAAATC